MYHQLKKIDHTPKPFEFYTAEKLWNDPHISKKMLEFHLDPDLEPASRNHGFISRSIDWITDRFRIKNGMAIADFGCGPGLYTTAFAQKGADVLGIDFSDRSIRYARKQATENRLPIQYVQQNYLDFQTDRRFDLITLIYCDFCVLGPDQRKRLLASVSNLLKEDGLIFLDVFSLSAFETRTETTVFEHCLMEGFWSINDYYGFLKTIRYEKEKVVLDKYTIIEPSGQREIYNWLQYFSRPSLTGELEQAGLKIRESYSDVAGTTFNKTSDTIAVVAAKI